VGQSPNLDFRGFHRHRGVGAGRGRRQVVVAASGKDSRVERIVTFDGDRRQRGSRRRVTLTLADEVDIARGDVLVPPQDRPEVTDQFAGQRAVDER